MNSELKWNIEHILEEKRCKKEKKFLRNYNKMMVVFHMKIIDYVQVNTKNLTYKKIIDENIKKNSDIFFENQTVLYMIEDTNTKFNNDGGIHKKRCYSPDCLACRDYCYKKSIKKESKQNKITKNINLHNDSHNDA